jgi:hypothetical protein
MAEITAQQAAFEAAVSSLEPLAAAGSLHPSLVIALYGCGDGSSDAQTVVSLLPAVFRGGRPRPSNITVSGICTLTSVLTASPLFPAAWQCSASLSRTLRLPAAADCGRCVSAVRRSC